MWPVLTILALAALAVLHYRWRSTCRRQQQASAQELEALRQEHRRWIAQQRDREQAIFNGMVEGLLLLDNQGRVELANQAFEQLFEVRGPLTGRTVLEVLRLHELPEMLGRISTDTPWLTRELRVPGAPELWLRVTAAAILHPDGRRQGTILVFHNLTRLKQLERSREEFVANVSHELRTPLSHIQGYVETLLDGARNDPEVSTRFLQTIARNSERLKLLIEDLLTISELESGRVTLNLQPVALRNLVTKVFDDFKALAGAKRVTLLNDVPDLRARADAGRIEQVLSNLLDNAVKYGREGGRVSVSARPAEDGKVEVFVQDDGPGLPPEALERVFERFYRVDKARSREQGGTGLGLSIVKHIIQTHGGRVWARSEPGHGATFFFTLPAAS